MEEDEEEKGEERADWSTLCDVALNNVFHYLPVMDIVNAGRTCRRWHACMSRAVRNAIRFTDRCTTYQWEPMEFVMSAHTTKMSPRMNHCTCFDPATSKLYVFGGEFPQQSSSHRFVSAGASFHDLWAFDMESREWSRILPTGRLPSPKCKSSMVLHHGHLILFGGKRNFQSTVTRQFATEAQEIHTFNLKTKTWNEITPTNYLREEWNALRISRQSHCAVMVDKYMVCVGGYNPVQPSLTVPQFVAVLDTVQWEWHVPRIANRPNLQPLPHEGCVGSAVLLRPGCLLFVPNMLSGMTQSALRTNGRARAFLFHFDAADIVNGEWSVDVIRTERFQRLDDVGTPVFLNCNGRIKVIHPSWCEMEAKTDVVDEFKWEVLMMREKLQRRIEEETSNDLFYQSLAEKPLEFSTRLAIVKVEMGAREKFCDWKITVRGRQPDRGDCLHFELSTAERKLLADYVEWVLFTKEGEVHRSLSFAPHIDELRKSKWRVILYKADVTDLDVGGMIEWTRLNMEGEHPFITYKSTLTPVGDALFLHGGQIVDMNNVLHDDRHMQVLGGGTFIARPVL